MSIELDVEGRACRARVEGEMTVYTAEEHRKAWLKHCKKLATRDLSLEGIDLSGVTEMDTAGLQLLAALEKRLSKINKGFCLVNPSECVQEVLARTGLAEQFVDTGCGRKQ